jgi:hypothetical protein
MGMMALLSMFLTLFILAIAITSVFGISLLIIGITGILMDNINRKQTNANHSVAVHMHNVGSIILGVVILLLPLIFLLTGIMSGIE